MKHATYSFLLAVSLGALLFAGCGDSGTPGIGGGGGLVCASDDPEVGNMITCPESSEMIDFCINTRNGNCYYQIGADRADCGNCFDNPTITGCATQAIQFCN